MPHAHEKSVQCLEAALVDLTAKQTTESKAKVFAKIKKSEAELGLQITRAWMTEQR